MTGNAGTVSGRFCCDRCEIPYDLRTLREGGHLKQDREYNHEAMTVLLATGEAVLAFDGDCPACGNPVRVFVGVRATGTEVHPW